MTIEELGGWVWLLAWFTFLITFGIIAFNWQAHSFMRSDLKRLKEQVGYYKIQDIKDQIGFYKSEDLADRIHKIELYNIKNNPEHHIRLLKLQVERLERTESFSARSDLLRRVEAIEARQVEEAEDDRREE